MHSTLPRLSLALGFLVVAGASAPAYAQKCVANNANCKLMNSLLPNRGASSPSQPSRAEEINRNAADAQQRINESFDRLREQLKLHQRNQSSAASGDSAAGDGIPIGDALKKISDDYDDAQRSARAAERASEAAGEFERQQREWAEQRRNERQRREQDAADLLRDAKQVLPPGYDCAALRSTPGVSMADECLTSLDRASTYQWGKPPPPAKPSEPAPVIDGRNIPSSIVFPRATSEAIERAFEVSPSPSTSPSPSPSPQASPRGSSDLDRAPDTPSTTLTPTYDPSPSSIPSDRHAPRGGFSEPVLPSPDAARPEQSRLEKVLDTIDSESPKRGPMRRPGAPDDTLQNHQRDMDRATNGWRLANPLKYPLEIQRVVNDKIDRILELQAPEK